MYQLGMSFSKKSYTDVSNATKKMEKLLMRWWMNGSIALKSLLHRPKVSKAKLTPKQTKK